MMNTVVVTFRGHKNLKDWVEYASKGFKGEGELLRLILMKAALEQSLQSGVSAFLKSIAYKKEIAVGIGNTMVFGVRLPAPCAEMIRTCAAKKDKSVSEWCYRVMIDWHQYFSQLYEKFNEDRGQRWLLKHGVEYRACVAEISKVYAQKTGVIRMQR
jgi:hypothetical protein